LVSKKVVEQGAKSAAVGDMASGASKILAYLFIAVFPQSTASDDDNIEIWMAAHSAKDSSKERIRTDAITSTRRRVPFIVVLQLQHRNNTIDSLILPALEEPGVTKSQAWLGLASLYNSNTASNNQWNRAFRSAVINMSKKIKKLQGGLGGINGNKLRSEFVFRKMLFRIDLENRAGINLKK